MLINYEAHLPLQDGVKVMGGLEKIPGEGKYRRGNQGKLQCAFLEITDFFFLEWAVFSSLCDLMMLPNMVFDILNEES